MEYDAPDPSKATTGNGTLAQRWAELEANKSSILSRCEEYASWTLPYILTRLNTADVELQGPLDSIGARSTNHLSNKLVNTLFAPFRSFFRIKVTKEAKDELDAQIKNKAQVEAAMVEVDAAAATAEQEAMSYSDDIGFRAEAVMAAKNLIITGNGLMYIPERDAAQSYSLRDYCVVRDIDGNVIEIMTRDTKAFGTFDKSVRDQLQQAKGQGHKCKDSDDIKLYTRVVLKEDKKFHVKQAAEEVMLTSKATYAADDLPWIVLTWNLVRGENYGRGLVEDYAGAFHACATLTQALVSGAAIAADIKFLVDPASVLDVAELNKSKTGSYHSGKEGDITSPQLNKSLDFQLAQLLLERFERQISQAFLMASGTTRDAERVTTVEIQRDALELEQSLGGVYSRQARQWQRPYALLLLKRIDYKLGTAYKAQIVTGMESLSRMGELDNLQMFIGDLAQISTLPEPVLAVLQLDNIIKILATARSVNADQVVKSQDQQSADQQARVAQEQQVIEAQAGAQVAVEAGKQAVKSE